MNLMRNIVGILAMTAVILSGVLLGLPGEANAKLHGGAAHFDGITKVHSSGHHGPGHNEHAHDHHDKSESMQPGAAGHAEHGPCNAMACSQSFLWLSPISPERVRRLESATGPI